MITSTHGRYTGTAIILHWLVLALLTAQYIIGWTMPHIGRNTPVDVTLYNIPLFASPIDVPTVQRLSEEFEKIVAIKDSSGDLPHMIRMIAAVRPNRPEFSFLTGWDAALMPMLLIGCDGGRSRGH